jgi:hypothetical protein
VESESTPTPESTPDATSVVDPSSEGSSTPVSAESNDFGILSVCAPTASIIGGLDFGISRWTAAGYETVVADLQIGITPGDAGCTGIEPDWEVRVSASSLSSSQTGESIPANHLSFIGSAPGNSLPAGIEPVTGSAIQLGEQPALIAGTTEADPGGGLWNARFSLSPPDSVPPGTYFGTITIDVVQSSG